MQIFIIIEALTHFCSNGRPMVEDLHDLDFDELLENDSEQREAQKAVLEVAKEDPEWWLRLDVLKERQRQRILSCIPRATPNEIFYGVSWRNKFHRWEPWVLFQEARIVPEKQTEITSRYIRPEILKELSREQYKRLMLLSFAWEQLNHSQDYEEAIETGEGDALTSQAMQFSLEDAFVQWRQGFLSGK